MHHMRSAMLIYIANEKRKKNAQQHNNFGSYESFNTNSLCLRERKGKKKEEERKTRGMK